MSFRRRDDSVDAFRADLARLADVARRYETAPCGVILRRPPATEACNICLMPLFGCRNAATDDDDDWEVCPPSEWRMRTENDEDLNVVVLSCGHWFHERCARGLGRERTPKCPQCREPLIAQDLDDLGIARSVARFTTPASVPSPVPVPAPAPAPASAPTAVPDIFIPAARYDGDRELRDTFLNDTMQYYRSIVGPLNRAIILETADAQLAAMRNRRLDMGDLGFAVLSTARSLIEMYESARSQNQMTLMARTERWVAQLRSQAMQGLLHPVLTRIVANLRLRPQDWNGSTENIIGVLLLPPFTIEDFESSVIQTAFEVHKIFTCSSYPTVTRRTLRGSEGESALSSEYLFLTAETVREDMAIRGSQSLDSRTFGAHVRAGEEAYVRPHDVDADHSCA